MLTPRGCGLEVVAVPRGGVQSSPGSPAQTRAHGETPETRRQAAPGHWAGQPALSCEDAWRCPRSRRCVRSSQPLRWAGQGPAFFSLLHKSETRELLPKKGVTQALQGPPGPTRARGSAAAFSENAAVSLSLLFRSGWWGAAASEELRAPSSFLFPKRPLSAAGSAAGRPWGATRLLCRPHGDAALHKPRR